MILMDVIEWLREMEELASKIYGGAAERFKDDAGFSEFFRQLGEEESWHSHLLASVSDRLQQLHANPFSFIAVEGETRGRIEKSLRGLQQALDSGEFDRRQMIEAMVQVERSEWNDIFCYVLADAQKYSRHFQHVAATIQRHEQHIEDYCAQLPRELRPADSLGSLPAIWHKTVLVADQDYAFRDLLHRIFDKKSLVVSAATAAEAMRQIEERYFDVIITDFDLQLDGVPLIRRAVERADPDQGRLVLCTTFYSPEAEQYASRHNIPLLSKPVSVRQIREICDQVLGLCN